MSEPVASSEMLLQPSTVEELIRTLVKALRAYQIYLPNNPIYHRAQDSVRKAFRPVWEVLDDLVLSIAETDFIWEDLPVYKQPNKHDSLAWTLFKDGMRYLTLKKGCEDDGDHPLPRGGAAGADPADRGGRGPEHPALGPGLPVHPVPLHRLQRRRGVPRS